MDHIEGTKGTTRSISSGALVHVPPLLFRSACWPRSVIMRAKRLRAAQLPRTIEAQAQAVPRLSANHHGQRIDGTSRPDRCDHGIHHNPSRSFVSVEGLGRSLAFYAALGLRRHTRNVPPIPSATAIAFGMVGTGGTRRGGERSRRREGRGERYGHTSMI